jgi:RNA polymerase sigma factor FliA
VSSLSCYPKIDAREQMIEKYIPYVKYIASRLVMGKPPGVEFEDLVGYGIIGLIGAVERFDPSKGIKFETFASLKIKGAIIDEFRKLSWMPKSAYSKLTTLNKVREQLEYKLSREPSYKELAEYMETTVEAIHEIETYVNYISVASLDSITSSSEDKDVEFKSVVQDQSIPQPEDVLEENERLEYLKRAIDMLGDKDKIILNLYYYEKLTLKSIGEVMGVSESRVSQLHSRAIIRLRDNLKKIRYI